MIELPSSLEPDFCGETTASHRLADAPFLVLDQRDFSCDIHTTTEVRQNILPKKQAGFVYKLS